MVSTIFNQSFHYMLIDADWKADESCLLSWSMPLKKTSPFQNKKLPAQKQ